MVFQVKEYFGRKIKIITLTVFTAYRVVQLIQGDLTRIKKKLTVYTIFENPPFSIQNVG